MSSVALAKEDIFINITHYGTGLGHKMKYVYLLQSISHPDKKYVGVTTDLNKRLKEHNIGKSPHTARVKPWKVVVAIRFADNHRADAFEKYLKSGSGHAFAKRHFW